MFLFKSDQSLMGCKQVWRKKIEIEGREKNGGSLEVMKDEREGEDDNQGDPKKKCVFYYFFTLI